MVGQYCYYCCACNISLVIMSAGKILWLLQCIYYISCYTEWWDNIVIIVVHVIHLWLYWLLGQYCDYCCAYNISLVILVVLSILWLLMCIKYISGYTEWWDNIVIIAVHVIYLWLYWEVGQYCDYWCTCNVYIWLYGVVGHNCYYFSAYNIYLV